jgi:hypothetical protein
LSGDNRRHLFSPLFGGSDWGWGEASEPLLWHAL